MNDVPVMFDKKTIKYTNNRIARMPFFWIAIGSLFNKHTVGEILTLVNFRIWLIDY